MAEDSEPAERLVGEWVAEIGWTVTYTFLADKRTLRIGTAGLGTDTPDVMVSYDVDTSESPWKLDAHHKG